MRSEQDVNEFAASTKELVLDACPECEGFDPGHECHKEYNAKVRAFEACIPQDFWAYTAEDVAFNREQFDQLVVPYTKKLRTALKHGYGMMFLGDNGVGKTMFISYILMEVCRWGLTAYYTTSLQLDHTIKRAFNDKALSDRLEWYLTSDWLAIDELGKEQFKRGDSFARTQVERILKQRFDDGRPTLIATNADLPELEKVYGATLTSILNGKYTKVMMDPGDFRNKMAEQMNERMGYGRKRKS